MTIVGHHYFESDFEPDVLDLSDFKFDEPGFVIEPAENLLLNENCRIFVEVLNAANFSAFGLGYVNYFDPNAGLLSAADRIRLTDGSNGTADLTLNETNIEGGSNRQLLGVTDEFRDLHDQLDFDLLDDATAPLEAYGVLLRLDSDFPSNGIGTIDLESEPGVASLGSLAVTILALKRRRRRSRMAADAKRPPTLM